MKQRGCLCDCHVGLCRPLWWQLDPATVIVIETAIVKPSG